MRDYAPNKLWPQTRTTFPFNPVDAEDANKAIVSATCEMVIQVINGQVDRYFDEEIGLNLLKL